MKTTLALFASFVLSVSVMAGQNLSSSSNTLIPQNQPVLQTASSGVKHILLPPGVTRATSSSAMGVHPADSPGPGAPPSNFPQGHGITYWGGKVITGTVNMYLIWYGNWSNSEAVNVVTTFMNALSQSPYYNINRSYYEQTLASDKSYARSSGITKVAGVWYDNYSQGTNNPDPFFIVQDAVNGRHLPIDTNAVYFIFTSEDVSIQGYGTEFCGYHSVSFAGSNDQYPLVYAMIGSGSSRCTVQPTKSPNDNPQGDALVNMIAHELSESVTDGTGSAWTNNDGLEMADLCEWTFGTEKTAPNGSKYNVTLGGHNYLVQRLWVNDGPGYCSVQWPATVPSDQSFQIVSKNSGLCLTAPGTSSQHGLTTYQESCNVEDNAQKFSFAPYNGGYKIIARGNGESLDIRGGPAATGDGVLLQTWPFWGGNNELFGYSDPTVSGGYGDIQVFNTGRVLDVWNASKSPYAEIQAYRYGAGANQLWKLVPVQ